ncbi:hypothetical protein MDAP_001388 [Mitosporidium daphniae]
MHPPRYAHSICCIGAGYVGGPTCAVIAEKCPDVLVTIADINSARISQWNSNSLPIYEPGLSEIVFRCRGRNLFFTDDVDKAIENADIIFIAVNTPTKKSGIGAGIAADTSFFESAVRRIALVSKSSKIIIEKSTVPCKTAEYIQHIFKVNKKDGVNFSILSNPEFLAEGTAICDLLNPDRILIGSFGNTEASNSGHMLASIYERWVPKERILLTNIWSSELAKLAANAMLAQRVSSINALSAVCEAVGADIGEVSRAIGSDSRIGPNFLRASIGFGGSCFKKDVLNLIYLCEEVIGINEYQKDRFVRRIITKQFGCISGKNIALFGFAFKKDTGDTRESPAAAIAASLIRERAHISIYDPKVSQTQIWNDFQEFGLLDEAATLTTIYSCPYSAANNCDAIVICTEWDEFNHLNYSNIFASMRKPAFIFDGRKLLNASLLSAIGFNVEQIGSSSFNSPALTADDRSALPASMSIKGIPEYVQQITTSEKLVETPYR